MHPSRLDFKSASDSNMTPEKALSAGRAVGTSYKKVSVGMDLSRSSKMIRDAFISGLMSVGSEVLDLGYVPSPAGALASSGMDCYAMIGSPDVHGVVSGITLRNADGSEFGEEQMKTIEKYSEAFTPLPGYLSVSSMKRDDSVSVRYIKKLVSVCGEIDCSVVVDCGCNSTSFVAPQILTAAGADVVSINSHPDRSYQPRFSGIEVSEAKDVQTAVKTIPGSIGILLNGDGTRVALVDEDGEYVSGNNLLALLVKYMKPKDIVIPIDVSASVDRAFWDGEKETEDRRIVKCEPDPVALCSTMKAEKIEFGALGNGSIILPGMTLCPDGVMAAAIISKYAGSNSLSDALDDMEGYITETAKIHFTGGYEALWRNIAESVKELDYTDVVHVKGWRVDMEHGWFLISFPDSEGIINIKAEARDKAYAVGLLEIAKEIVNDGIRSQ
ncbi:MAG: hypothetical protein ACOX8L_02495 [Candidatus Methanomethylophilaceae archaeon]|jgi:phosphoglucosamine mutase